MTDVEQITAKTEPAKWLPKYCPVCKKANDTEVRICTCGYWFDQQELLRQASDVPDVKRRALKRRAKKVLIIGGFVAIILSVVAIWTGAIEFGKGSEAEKELAADRAVDSTGRHLAAVTSKGPLGTTMACKVTAVTSGDTITVRDLADEEHRIRLSGIGAPEGDQGLAQQAKEDLASLILDKTVTIVLQKFDENDLAGKVLLDGKNINSELVRAGLAWHNQYSVLQTDEDRQLYSDAEAFAKAGKFGVWSNPNAVPPWETRPAADLTAADERTVVDKADKPSRSTSEYPSASSSPEAVKVDEKPQNVAPVNPAAEQKVVTAEPEVVVPTKPEVEKSKPARSEPLVSEKRFGATARCNDGSLSYRTTRPGSCSGNGGVAEWLAPEKSPVRIDANGKKYTLGPRGGCFYINTGGSKVYVDKGLCSQ